MTVKFFAGPSKVAVRPVVFAKKGGLVVPEGRSLRRARIGRVLSESVPGIEKGTYVMYRAELEERAHYHGRLLLFVRLEDILAIVEPAEDDEIRDPLEVDQHLGVDDEWYGAA